MNEEVLILIAHTHARQPVVPGDVIAVSTAEADWLEQHRVADRMNGQNDPPASGVETHDDEPQSALEAPETSQVKTRKK